MQTSNVKQHKDETASSGLGYFWATVLIFIEIKTDLKGGKKVFSVWLSTAGGDDCNTVQNLAWGTQLVRVGTVC